MDGGYRAASGARTAPAVKNASDGATIGDDFPQLCETCLGSNPYVRMTKLPFGLKLCKISNVPYQAFKWKAGPGGRFKETLISHTVAAERNICQTCLNDMVYGVPVGVRDRLLQQQPQEAHNQVSLPTSSTSAVGVRFHYQQQEALVRSGQAASQQQLGILEQQANVAPSRQLTQFTQAMQRAQEANGGKVAFRNLPKLCSFWLNGTCTRVVRGSCPYRPCCGTHVFPEIAGSNKELCAGLVAALNEKGAARVMKEGDLTGEIKDAIRESMKGNRDDMIRKRVSGEDDLTKKYLGKMKSMHMELDVPQDQSIVTLWLGGIEPHFTEADIRGSIYAHGTIESVFIARGSNCAFVEYVDRQNAEKAAKEMFNVLTIQGKPISVKWAKPKTIDGGAGSGTSNSCSSSGKLSETLLLPPPGMESAPLSAYALRDHNNTRTVTGATDSNSGIEPMSKRQKTRNISGTSTTAEQQQEQRQAAISSSSFAAKTESGAASMVIHKAQQQVHTSALASIGDYSDDDNDGGVVDNNNNNNSSVSMPSSVVTLKKVAYPSMNPARLGAK